MLRKTAPKAAFTPDNMLPGNMLPSTCCLLPATCCMKQHVAGNKIVASLLPVCCCIPRDTCCRDTSNMLLGNMLPYVNAA